MIENLTIEVDDVPAADAFYQALAVGPRVHPAPMTTPLTGFRGYVLGLQASQPADVDALVASALEAGGQIVTEASRSMRRYGATLTAPDGTVVRVSSPARTNAGPASRELEEIVLHLGVDELARTRAFYLERGLELSKRLGRLRVETADGAVGLSFTVREKLARDAGVEADGDRRAHGLILVGGAESFIDPDGFVWVAA